MRSALSRIRRIQDCPTCLNDVKPIPRHGEVPGTEDRNEHRPPRPEMRRKMFEMQHEEA